MQAVRPHWLATGTAASEAKASIRGAVRILTVSAKARKFGWHGSWVPHGWFKGRKTGWNGHHMPPGWFKGHRSGWNEHHEPHGLHSEMDDDRQD